jgi:AraC family transcriptional regulator of adaptative response / DNA-3-methyladenine glycosylase II
MLSRDPRFDGTFFIGVFTTGIYCRPVCPVRPPKLSNVHFYACAAAAEAAGFRPCRRCLPETAARVPEWSIGSRTVIRGLRLIDSGLLDEVDTATLAEQLGVGARHLSRLFREELGATPKSLAMTRRRALAKRLIDETDLPLSEVALQAGYRSLRRFNDDIQACYRRSPRLLRASRRRRSAPGAVNGTAGGDGFSMRLPVREPYHAAWVFEFLRRRALEGFETVTDFCYRRRLPTPESSGGPCWISVTWDGVALRLDVPGGCTVPLSDILPRVRRVFDLDADSRTIDADLAQDPVLAPVVAAHGGLRVPGAWDGFETTVRAILGQQVSVDRATVLANALLARFGSDCLLRPAVLAAATPAEVGMPGRRGQAISALAEAVASGAIRLNEGADATDLQQALCAVPGIGPWTAGYVAMRVVKDPDAFPVNDWVVLKMLEAQVGPAARAAAAGRPGSRAEQWRPWRAYAVMYLWRLSQETREGAPDRRKPASAHAVGATLDGTPLGSRLVVAAPEGGG